MIRLVPLTSVLLAAGWSLGDAGVKHSDSQCPGAPVLPPGALKQLEKPPNETCYPIGRWVRGSFGVVEKDGSFKGVVIRCLVAQGDDVEGGYCYQVEVTNKTESEIFFGWGLLDVMDKDGDGKGLLNLYPIPKGRTLSVELHSEDEPMERTHRAVLYMKDEKTGKLVPYGCTQPGPLPRGVAGRKSL